MKYIVVILAILAACAPLARSNLSVIDGDSVRFLGENVRLVGFDTPETFRPKCCSKYASNWQASKKPPLLEGDFMCDCWA